MSKRLVLLLVFTALFFAGCDKLLNRKIPEDTFVSYYIDYLAAQDSLGKDPAATQKILTTLNAKYKVTPALYEKTLQYYSEEPDRWEAFFDKVTAEIQKKRLKKA